MTSNWFVNMAYFIAAIVFIFGLKAMASPVTARKGVVWAGYAMIAATLATFFIPDLHNIGLMVVAIGLFGFARLASLDQLQAFGAYCVTLVGHGDPRP